MNNDTLEPETVETARECRQGRSGMRVPVILGVSTLGAVLAGFLIVGYWNEAEEGAERPIATTEQPAATQLSEDDDADDNRTPDLAGDVSSDSARTTQ